MATYTTNFKLKKPDGSDTVDISDINGNMDTIDEEIENTVKMAVKSVTVSGNSITVTLINGRQISGTISNASTSASGLMSTTDKSKLDSMSVKTASAASSITSGTKIGTITINGTTTTFYYKDTFYNTATSSANGLMSKTDKAKLDGITSSADSVSFTRNLTSGTKIGTITINGTSTVLYSTNNTTYTTATDSVDGLLSASYHKKLSKLGTMLTKSGTFSLSPESWANSAAISFGYGTWVITATAYFTADIYGKRCIAISDTKVTQHPDDVAYFSEAATGGVAGTLQKTRVVHGDSSFTMYFAAWNGGYCDCKWAIEAVRIA